MPFPEWSLSYDSRSLARIAHASLCWAGNAWNPDGCDLDSRASTRGFGTAEADSKRGVANGSYYALVIGIDVYPAPLPKLKTAVADARAIAVVLKERYGFQVQTLLDHDATRVSILDAIAHYRNTLGTTDNLLIYYAGHGYADHEADKSYWLPIDADSIYSANRIIADDLTTDIRVLPARHVLLISDSCYSGGLSRDPNVIAQSEGQQGFLDRMLRTRSRTLMASGGDEPVSDGGSNGHSVFANAVLTALSSMSRAEFTASDLFYNSVRQQVAGKSSQLPQYSIIRNSDNGDGDFVFTLPSADEHVGSSVSSVDVPSPPLNRTPSEIGDQEKKQIQDVLDKYAAGFNKKDVKLIQAVWPSIPKEQLKTIRDFLRDRKSINMQLTMLDASPAGKRVTVDCSQFLQYDDFGKQKSQTNPITLYVVHRDTGWEIDFVPNF